MYGIKFTADKYPPSSKTHRVDTLLWAISTKDDEQSISGVKSQVNPASTKEIQTQQLSTEQATISMDNQAFPQPVCSLAIRIHTPKSKRKVPLRRAV